MVLPWCVMNLLLLCLLWKNREDVYLAADDVMSRGLIDQSAGRCFGSLSLFLQFMSSGGIQFRVQLASLNRWFIQRHFKYQKAEDNRRSLVH